MFFVDFTEDVLKIGKGRSQFIRLKKSVFASEMAASHYPGGPHFVAAFSFLSVFHQSVVLHKWKDVAYPGAHKQLRKDLPL